MTSTDPIPSGVLAHALTDLRDIHMPAAVPL